MRWRTACTTGSERHDRTLHHEVEEVRTGVECASDNVARGLYGGASATGGLQECANACAVQPGCSFFIYGVGSQAGRPISLAAEWAPIAEEVMAGRGNHGGAVTGRLRTHLTGIR